MARESQGLQIALIVFVMFTIILGVTTFMFSKEYGKAKGEAADAKTAAADALASQKAAEEENMRIKEILGHDKTAAIDTVNDAHDLDMNTYGKNYPEATRAYRMVCQWLYEEVDRKNKDLTDQKARVQELKDLNAGLEAAKESQIQQLLARAKKAEEERDAAKAEYQAARVQLVTLTKQQQQTVQQERADRQQTELALNDTIKTVTDERDKLVVTNTGLVDKIIDLDPIVPDSPDGQIRYVNQGARTVWIDAGRADGLAPLTNFAVYDADNTDMTADGKKGSIEVITLLDNNTAEARIIEDSIGDPIMPGDLIHTPLWERGQRVRFALTDGMDIDGDGRSDLDEVRNLITLKGGQVDFFLTDDGKPTGTISADTRFLVVGDEPTESNSMERINARTAALDEAKTKGLRRIKLPDLLNRMGYVRQNPVVHYGAAANPNDFRAQPPAGSQRESSGNVSDLFQKRTPPQPAMDSAY